MKEIITWLRQIKNKLSGLFPSKLEKAINAVIAICIGVVVLVIVLREIGATWRDLGDLSELDSKISGLFTNPSYYPSVWLTIAVLVLIALSLYLYASGRKDGYQAGYAKGEKNAKEAGRNDEYQNGYAKGVEDGRKKEQELSQTELFKPLRDAFAQLNGKLEANALDKERSNVITAYAEVVSAWNNLVVNVCQADGQFSITRLKIALQVLIDYLTLLPEQKNPSTNKHFLPANFEMYAKCVANILKIVSELTFNNGTIKVWTHLRKPIERWYNLSEGDSPHTTGLKYAHSFCWWEDYKNRIKGFKNKSSIQVRRIVSLPVNEKTVSPEQLAVYPPNGPDRLYYTIDEATKMRRAVISNCCPELLPEIEEALKFTGDHADYPLYLIGKCQHPLGTHLNWDQLKRNFDKEYHNEVVTHPGVVSADTKGVYCIYDDQPATQYEYDDIFLVNMKGVGAGVLGIAYYTDSINDRSGIVFLGDEAVEEQLSFLSGIWNRIESAEHHGSKSHNSSIPA